MTVAMAHVSSSSSGSGSIFAIRNGNGLRGMQQRRVLCRPSARFLVSSLWSRCFAPQSLTTGCIKANLDGNFQPRQNQKTALDDPQVSVSRDSMEDTVGSGASDMLQSLAGKEQEQLEEVSQEACSDLQSASRDSMEGTSGSGASEVVQSFSGDSNEGKTGVQAFEQKQQSEIDGIEQQFVLNDNLQVGEPEESAVAAPESDSTSQGSSPSAAVHPNNPGRDWRVWAEGGNKRAAWPAVTEDVNNDYELKQLLGWSEMKCDAGSQFLSSTDSGISSADNSVAERLGTLEELVMKQDDGRSAEDYNRRANIFEKSGKVFKARKEKSECI